MITISVFKLLLAFISLVYLGYKFGELARVRRVRTELKRVGLL